MRSTRNRTLVDVALLVAVAWLWFAIYESFTRTGVWLLLSRLVGGVSTLPSELALLSLSVLVGWACIAAVCWILLRVIASRRRALDFPAARVSR